MYVFGYGSLIWKVDFPFESRQIAYVKGFVRRFWQSSNDHRGTPLFPGIVQIFICCVVQTSLGIVVTLLPYPIYEQLFKSLDTHHSEKDDLLYGVLYKVADSDIESVRAHLDHREKNGYTTHITTTFHPSTHNPISTQTLIYVATHENEAFVGPSLEHPLTISKSVGPSGLNRDYLFALEKSLKVIMPKGKRDVHVENLCDEVRRLLVGADDEERKGKIKDEDLDELKKLLLLS